VPNPDFCGFPTLGLRIHLEVMRRVTHQPAASRMRILAEYHPPLT
jgi:hypothetical protein